MTRIQHYVRLAAIMRAKAEKDMQKPDFPEKLLKITKLKEQINQSTDMKEKAELSRQLLQAMKD